MKKMIFVMFLMLFSLSSVSYASPVVSIKINDFDSTGVLQIAGGDVLSVSAYVSGIVDEVIDDLQFDLVLPPSFFSWETSGITYGDAVTDWLNIGELASDTTIFRVISSQFLSPTSLQNGTLFTGLNILVDTDISAGDYFIEVGNKTGNNADKYILEPGPKLTSAVPIPGAVWLLGSGLAGLIALRRKNS